jgi:hypothetical protein
MPPLVLFSWRILRFVIVVLLAVISQRLFVIDGFAQAFIMESAEA